MVKVGGALGFDVQGGSLVSKGTVASHAVITSFKDDSAGGDTNGDGPSTGAVGDYATAVNLGPGGTLTDTFLEIRDAAFPVTHTL